MQLHSLRHDSVVDDTSTTTVWHHPLLSIYHREGSEDRERDGEVIPLSTIQSRDKLTEYEEYRWNRMQDLGDYRKLRSIPNSIVNKC